MTNYFALHTFSPSTHITLPTLSAGPIRRVRKLRQTTHHRLVVDELTVIFDEGIARYRPQRQPAAPGVRVASIASP
jgi:hypothetical protein